MSDTEELIFEASNFFEAIIIGGGTCGLAVAARLCEAHPGSIYTDDEHQRFVWLKQRKNNLELINSKMKTPKDLNRFSANEILVLDAVSDSFMGQWDSQFKNCKIPFLRSPMFFHPDPFAVDGLVTYAESVNRFDDKNLMQVKNVVGKEYSKHKMKNSVKKMACKSSEKKSTHNRNGLVDVNMRDWKDYYRPSTPLFKDFCTNIVKRYELENVVKKDTVVSIEYRNISIPETSEKGEGFVIKTASGKTYCSKVCILASGHGKFMNYPIEPFMDIEQDRESSCHTLHVFSGEVSIPPTRIEKKIATKLPTKIVVVGGGQTAAQIVDAAINEGVSQVFLLSRDRLKIKHFDFHLEWVTKYRNVKKAEFFIKDTDEERYDMIQDARQGGSMNPEYYRKLKHHIKGGRLEHFTQSQIVDASWDPERMIWSLKVKKSSVDKKEEEEEGPEEKETFLDLEDIDYIYFATGIRQDIEHEPCLKHIHKNHRIPIIKGFPCLTDDLQWNSELPLFVLGKSASLRIGPSSANLDGARLGSERVGWFVQQMRRSGKLNWKPKYEDANEIQVYAERSNLDVSTKADSSFQTRLKLASGEMNWFSLLKES